GQGGDERRLSIQARGDRERQEHARFTTLRRLGRRRRLHVLRGGNLLEPHERATNQKSSKHRLLHDTTFSPPLIGEATEKNNERARMTRRDISGRREEGAIGNGLRASIRTQGVPDGGSTMRSFAASFALLLMAPGCGRNTPAPAPNLPAGVVGPARSQY